MQSVCMKCESECGMHHFDFHLQWITTGSVDIGFFLQINLGFSLQIELFLAN